MLSTFQSVFLLIASTAGALLFSLVLNRIWPREKRRQHNDQIGWQLSVLGTTYAVILGFMLYAVWSEFGAAELNVGLEANALVNLYSLAQGLPDAPRIQLQQLTHEYATAALQQEWPQMAQGEVPGEDQEVNRKMWRVITSIKTSTATELTAEDHALSELTALTQYRRTRILQSSSRMPPVLWAVLIVGGVLSITSSCLFGASNEALHTLQVFAFALLISLGLVTIGDINRPFQGWVHVNTFAFERAEQSMQLQ